MGGQHHQHQGRHVRCRRILASGAGSAGPARGAGGGRGTRHTATMTQGEALKRLGGGRWKTADDRFTIEPQSGSWVVVDAEQTDDLGLPLVRGPFASLTGARTAIDAARTGDVPISPLAARVEEERLHPRPATVRAPKPPNDTRANAKPPGKQRPKPPAPPLPPTAAPRTSVDRGAPRSAPIGCASAHRASDPGCGPGCGSDRPGGDGRWRASGGPVGAAASVERGRRSPRDGRSGARRGHHRSAQRR